ncbi:hypothetical protein E4V42_12180 [Clostridium estertheticum]|uniref:Uncharacterized protein n=1 Tax=Clostridium estertheticum TaxID=238834 RepID=A0A5N7J278_9CLOT|nr:hypothetical protein [Clostridium estertheticum]MPQ32187.1 hypothetical protein [Clostridium estertheticum]MPQ62847.1 hypothetical protein [Clostridium estertheticum]
MKIDIIGAVGSGNTTLSSRIAKEFHINCYQQDNIVLMDEYKWHHEFNNDRKQLISELLQCGLRYKRFKNANSVIKFCYNTYELK